MTPPLSSGPASSKNDPASLPASSRRDLLKLCALGGAALFGSGVASMAGWLGGNSVSPQKPKRALRLAQITDVHLQPELHATEGFTNCLRHLQSQKDAPGLILNTGDAIMDSMVTDNSRTRLQWDLWKKVLQQECSLPVAHALGNHDCWGLNRTKSGTTGEEPLWGKQWALAAFGLARPYYSFDRAGWHFIVLDSVEPFQDSYKARLGEEQLVWLKGDLAAVPSGVPILVMSHIPVVSAGVILNGCKETDTHDLNVPGGVMHLDAKEIHDLFRAQGNVKLCLSGHLHIQERAEYDGVTYISSGAVSAAWWQGKQLGRFDYGYALVDLHTDGSFHYDYVNYGGPAAQVEAPHSSFRRAKPVGKSGL